MKLQTLKVLTSIAHTFHTILLLTAYGAIMYVLSSFRPVPKEIFLLCIGAASVVAFAGRFGTKLIRSLQFRIKHTERMLDQ